MPSLVNFDYARPKTLDAARKLLEANPQAMLLAGGQTLIPTLKQRLSRPSMLVDLQSLDELKGIEVTPSSVTVGAMTRHAQVAEHKGLARAIPALAFLAQSIAHPQVRRMGTMGGSICNNDPAADYPAALLALGASVETTQRVIAADAFFTGLFATALEKNEIVLRIRFPIPLRAGYQRIANPASGYVVCGCFIAQGFEMGDVRVAINGAGPCAFRQSALEALLAKNFSLSGLEGFTQSAQGLNSDLHASGEYRAALVRVAAERALEQAWANSKNEG